MDELQEFGLSTMQIRTGISLEELHLSKQEKAKANKKIRKIITNSTFKEIDDYINKWCEKKEGSDVLKYIIYMLDDIIFLSQNELLNYEMAKYRNDLEHHLNQSLELAKKSSYLD